MSTDEPAGRGRDALGPSLVGWRRLAPRAAPWVAVLLWFLLAGWGLGSYPLSEPDEGRNGTAALEVATGGHWLVPTYDGVVLLDKPLLWFDAAALAILGLGPGELAVRLPSLLFTAATLLLVARFASRLYGSIAAWVAGLVLATSPLVLTFARIAIFDPMLGFFVVLALVLFHEAVQASDGRAGAGRVVASAWLAMAAGVLVKGPVAVAIPLLVAVPYAAWRRRTRAVWSWAGAAGFLALVGGWAGYVEWRVPGYLEYVVLTETWGRLTSSVESVDLGWSGPIRSLVPILVGGTLPWCVIAAWGWAHARRRGTVRGDGGLAAQSTAFLVLWLVVPLLLFAYAEPKRLQYMVPVVPAVALLLAAVAARGAVTPGAIRAGAVTLVPVGAALLLAGLQVWPVLGGLHEELLAPAHRAAVVLGLLLLLASAAGGWWARSRPPAAVLALALPGLLLPAVLFPTVARVSELRSTEGLAREISTACPGAPVVGIGVLPASLPFYLGRPVGLNSPTGHAFQSNYVEKAWPEIAASRPLFATAWWQDLPTRSVVVFERWEDGKRLGAELQGFRPLAENRLYAAYGRECGAPPEE